MTFQPIIPLGGLPGWALLNRTLDRQTEIFNASPQIVRDTDYFEQKIGDVRTAEDLVSDRRLLRVALGAFGLTDDLNSRALIQRVLEEGTKDRAALANRLSDERYKKLTNAFGFAEPGLPNTRLSGFGREIADKFRRMEFEVAVGAQDESLRLAMNTQRELGDIAGSSASDNAKWFGVMGNPPLRRVFEVALGLPKSFGQLDIDQQLGTFRDAAKRQLGIDSISDLADGDKKEKLIQRYLLRDQVSSFQIQSSGAIALNLLQMAPRPAVFR